jgi:hypothetical protein
MTTTDTVPATFAADFWRLARRCQIPGGRLDPGTVADYWTALRDLPLEVLTASAEELARTRVFFPAVAEWRQAARGTKPETIGTDPETICTACGGYGVIRVAYHSGAAFDLALCGCRAGRWYRAVGVDFVRARFHLASDHRIAPVEEFDEPGMEG